MGLPPEAKAFSKFRSSKVVISTPSAFGFQKIAYILRGLGAYPQNLKHFPNSHLQKWRFVGLQAKTDL